MQNQNDQRILISGAGLAGMTTALAFADRGFSILMMEKAPALSEVGAGLQLAPNATRLLERLGVMDDLLPQAVSPQALYLMDGVKAQPLILYGTWRAGNTTLECTLHYMPSRRFAGRIAQSRRCASQHHASPWR